MNARRFVIVGDNHGDEIDPVCEKAFFNWLSDWNPEIRICSGDLFDFAALRNGASQEDKAKSMKADYDAGMRFARRLFREGEIKVMLRGNHDERMWDLLYKQDGALQDFAEQKTKEIGKYFKRWGVKMLPYDARLGVYRIGKLQVIHGFKSGIGAAKQHATIYRSCVFGHTHSQDIVPVENLTGPALAMGTGCMCYIDMPYNARQCNKLRHQQGWVYGVLYPDGSYQAFQAKRVGDSFNLATGVKSY